VRHLQTRVLVEESTAGDYRLSANTIWPEGTMMTYADFGAFMPDRANAK